MPAINHDLAATARRNHGVVTLEGAEAAKISRRSLTRAVERGELERVHPGVYRIGGAPRTWHQSLLLAVLAAGPTALASHRSAARLWGLDGSTLGRPEVVTARHLRSRYSEARIHESTDLHLADRAERERIPCTGIERTLVDLGAVVPLERVQQAVDDAVRRKLCGWEDLAHALAMHSRRGRRGVGPLRSVLEVSAGLAIPDSRFNRLVERLLIAHGLPAPTVEHDVRDRAGRFLARVDLAYPRLLIAIELDGKQHHLTTAAFERDRARQNQLELEGWLVLRYTWKQYLERPTDVVAEIAAALRARGG